MHAIKQKILEAFQRFELQPLATSQIVFYIYGDIQSIEQKSKLHRKILYHINNLVQDNILEVSQIVNKGEKLFVPKVKSGEQLVISEKSQTITLQPRRAPFTPIEKYEKDGFLTLFDSFGWIERANAVIIDPIKFPTYEDLRKQISLLFSCINDVVGLNDFEKMVEQHSVQDSIHFLEGITKECEDYERQICLVFDATNIMNEEKLERVLLYITKINSDKITTIFDVTTRELMIHRDVFERVSLLFAKNGKKLNFKNDEQYPAPYIVGKAGPYAIDIIDWQNYLVKGYMRSAGFCVSQSCIVIDVDKCMDAYPHAKSLVQLGNDIAKSLFIANELQRKNSKSYFGRLFESSYFNRKDFFRHARSFVRFVNYSKLTEQKYSLEQMQLRIDAYAKRQEVLYLSCGLPMRFAIGFSQAYRQYGGVLKVTDSFDRIVICSGSQINSSQVRNIMKIEESANELLRNGNELRVERGSSVTPSEVLGECALLLNSYKIPFLCYKFTVDQSKKLSEFIKNEI